MASSFAALEDMIQRTMSRVQRNEEDMTAIGTTVLETQADVRDLKLDMRWLTQDVGRIKIDVHVLKKDMVSVKHDVHDLKEDMVVVKQDISGLKQNVDEFKHDVSRDMGWLKRAVQALVTHQGVAVESDDSGE